MRHPEAPPPCSDLRERRDLASALDQARRVKEEARATVLHSHQLCAVAEELLRGLHRKPAK